MATPQAVEYDAQGKPLPTSPQGVEYDAEGKPLSTPPAQPGMLSRIGSGIGDVFQGIGAGALSTANNIGKIVYPDVLAKHLTGVPTPEAEDKLFGAHNATQKIAKGAEQVGEFMAPGALEEEGATKLASLMPRLGKAAAPIARIGTSALSSGAVNAAQGGSPVTGALMGAGGSAIGQGLKAAAPTLTGIAQGLKAPSGKTGKAILDETKGVLPGSIRNSARGVLDKLNPELDRAAKEASVKPNPVRALLPPPPTEIPTAGPVPYIRDTPGELIPAARMPQGNISGMGTDLSPTGTAGRIRGVPGRQVQQLGSTANTVPARMMREAYVTAGEHTPQELPTSGPGVLIRPFEGKPGGIPPTIPNTTVSLARPRQVAQELTDRAFGQNEPKMYRGVNRMARMVNEDLEGNPLPEQITPYQALELKRGIGKAQPKGSWNPESSNAFKGPRTSLYKSLNTEFENAVPEAAPLNRRISALIPATEPPKNFFFGHALGPGVGATLGGVGGYRRGIGPEGTDIGNGLKEGALGALGGAAAGYAVPAAMNAAARMVWSPALGRYVLPAAEGAILQGTRNKENQ